MRRPFFTPTLCNSFFMSTKSAPSHQVKSGHSYGHKAWWYGTKGSAVAVKNGVNFGHAFRASDAPRTLSAAKLCCIRAANRRPARSSVVIPRCVSTLALVVF
jgi:hypothetical protein